MPAGRSALPTRRRVHGAITPRHLAFSCYGFDGDGRLLVTQRARTKLTSRRCGPTPAAGIRRPVRNSGRRGHPPDAVRTRPGAARPADGVAGLQLSGVRRAGRGERVLPGVGLRVSGDGGPAPTRSTQVAWWSWHQFLDAAADPTSGCRRGPASRPRCWTRRCSVLPDPPALVRGPALLRRGSTSTAR